MPIPRSTSRIADARQQQKLRRLERARRQDDFALGANDARSAPLPILDADGPRALEDDARRARPRSHGEIRPTEIGREVRRGRAPPLAIFLRQLIEADALLLRAIEVGVARQTLLHRCGNADLHEGARRSRIGDVERAALSVKGVGESLVVLGSPEIRKHIVVRPSCVAERRPFVVVAAVAADVDHRVDRAAAAERLAARLIAATAARRPACGTVLKAQLCRRLGTSTAMPSGMRISGLESRAPASIRQTDTDGSSESRAARTQPAEPAPTMT